MIIQALGVLLSAYFVFAFVAEARNPFEKPNSHFKRNQWRYGRRAGAAVLGSGLVFLLMQQFMVVSVRTSLFVSGVVFAAVWLLIWRHMHARNPY